MLLQFLDLCAGSTVSPEIIILATRTIPETTEDERSWRSRGKSVTRLGEQINV